MAFTDKHRLVGDEAVMQAHRNPLHTVFDIKRFLGSTSRVAFTTETQQAQSFNVILVHYACLSFAFVVCTGS